MQSSLISEGDTVARPAVLLTNTDRWPGPARLAMALAKAGFDVSALCPVPGHPLSKTRCVRTVIPYNGYRPLQSLIAAIERTGPDLLIPCDDLAVRQLHELHAYARETSATGLLRLVEKSLGVPAHYATVSGRFDILKLAGEEGILVPDTKRIDCRNDVVLYAGKIGFPMVLKADGSWGGRGVRIAETADQAQQAWTELSEVPSVSRAAKRLLLERDRFWIRTWFKRTRFPITAQSHITGRPANCAVVCWEGEVLAGIAVEVISTQELTGPAIVVRVVDSDAMLSAAERIARRLGISGFFGLDFMIDESDETYLIEMNPRCTPLCHLQLGRERDLIGKLRSKLTGQAYQPTPPVTENNMIAYYPRAKQTASKFLASSFHDVPLGEPELIDELLNPWSGRSALGRFIDRIRPKAGKAQNQPCIFEAAAADRSVS